MAFQRPLSEGAAGSWFYEMVDLGYNYRLTDFQCALGLSQLPKLRAWVRRRQEIARIYDRELGRIPALNLCEYGPMCPMPIIYT